MLNKHNNVIITKPARPASGRTNVANHPPTGLRAKIGHHVPDDSAIKNLDSGHALVRGGCRASSLATLLLIVTAIATVALGAAVAAEFPKTLICVLATSAALLFLAFLRAGLHAVTSHVQASHELTFMVSDQIRTNKPS